MWNRTDTRKPLALALVVLSGLAWLALWLWDRSPYGRYLSHHALEAVRGNAALLVVFVGGWVVMVVAMMLPTSLPLITMFGRVVSKRPDNAVLSVLLITGYVAIWTLFGAAAHTGDRAVHAAVNEFHWLEDNSYGIGAATLIIAGAYQFTPLKYICLDK